MNKEIGFLSPDRFITKLNLSYNQYEVLFEEEIEKQLIESNGFRDGVMVRPNQSIYWDYKYRQYSENCIKLKEYELITKDAISDNIKHYGECLDGSNRPHIFRYIPFEITNSNFIKDNLTLNRSLRVLSLAQNLNYSVYSPPKSKRPTLGLYHHIMQEYSWHSNQPINLNYYYNSFDQEFIPIFADGNPNFSELQDCQISNKNNFIKIIDEYRYRTNRDITEKQLCAIDELSNYIDKNELNLNNLDKTKFNFFEDLKKEEMGKLELLAQNYKLFPTIKEKSLLYDSNKNYWKICDFYKSLNINCKKTNFNKIKSLVKNLHYDGNNEDHTFEEWIKINYQDI